MIEQFNLFGEKAETKEKHKKKHAVVKVETPVVNEVDVSLKVKAYGDIINLSRYQLRTLCECLYEFKDHIKRMDIQDDYHRFRTDKKLKEVDKLFNIIEAHCNYAGGSFNKALEKCINKKEDKSDIGEDAMQLALHGMKS